MKVNVMSLINFSAYIPNFTIHVNSSIELNWSKELILCAK